MGALAQSLAIRANSAGADDRYYSTQPVYSLAGVNVSPDAALRVAAVFACTRVLAETMASLPCITYRRRPDGGKERAGEHPLYELLHDQPNDTQTAVEFFEQMTGWAALRGNAVSEVAEGQRGPVDQIIPLHPDRMKAERVRGRFGSAVRYEVTEPDGITKRYLLSDQVLHLRGMTDDGIRGLATVTLARDTVGVALAAEQHAARTFSQGARPGGVLEHPGKLGEEGKTGLRKQLDSEYVGPGANKTLILEEGMKWHQVSLTNRDAEFLATRKFSVTEICRWFRVPPHMVADLERATFSNIEQQSLEFVIYTMLPWFRRWEQAIRRDLIVAKPIYFAEFLVAGLLRGNLKERYEAYAIARQWGWLSVNDIRRLENENPIAGGDRYLEPMNMTTPGGTMAFQPQTPTGSRMLQLLAGDAASRVLRKELAAMRKLAERTAEGEGWEQGVRAFYDDHAAHVARELHLDMAEAESWVDRARAELLADGPGTLDRWEDGRSDDLAAVALRTEPMVADTRPALQLAAGAITAEIHQAPIQIDGMRLASAEPPIIVNVPAPVVNVPEPVVNVAAPVVTVQMPTVVSRSLERDTDGRATAVIEQHADGQTVRRVVKRDAKGRITEVKEDRGEQPQAQ